MIDVRVSDFSNIQSAKMSTATGKTEEIMCSHLKFGRPNLQSAAMSMWRYISQGTSTVSEDFPLFAAVRFARSPRVRLEHECFPLYVALHADSPSRRAEPTQIVHWQEPKRIIKCNLSQ